MLKGIAVALAAALVAGQAAARDLTVVAFGGGFQDNARRHLFQAFAAASGQPVRDDVYNGGLARIAAMVRARDVPWDVVMVEAPELARGCADGLFERINWSVVTRDKFVANAATDCGAGAVGWGVALFYDRARIPDGPEDYAQLWDVQRWPGKRLLRYGAKMTLEIALLSDGVARAEVYRVLATKEGQDRAFDRLAQIRPSLRWWKSGTQPQQLVGAGEVAFAVGYVGRTAGAARDGGKYALLWNTLLYSFDSWAVVKGSPNAAASMRMIEFMTDPKPLLALSQDWALSPATRAAAEDREMQARNPGMVANHIAEGLFIDTGFWAEHGEELEKRFAAWAEQ